MKRYAALVVVAGLLLWSWPSIAGTQQPAPTGPPVVPVPGVVQPAPAGSPAQPAVAVTTVPSPASPQNPTDQVMWALAASLLLRYVTKKRWLSFLTPDAEPNVKALIGFLTAFSTATGIHFIVNGSPFDGHGATLTITGLSFDLIKDVGFQWVAQQAWYEGLVKQVPALQTIVQQTHVELPPTPPAIHALINLKGTA